MKKEKIKHLGVTVPDKIFDKIEKTRTDLGNPSRSFLVIKLLEIGFKNLPQSEYILNMKRVGLHRVINKELGV